MKARIMFDTTVLMRSKLLEISKKEKTHFDALLRSVLRNYIHHYESLYETNLHTGEEESSLKFLPYKADEGATGENIIAQV